MENKTKFGGFFTIEHIRNGEVIDKWEDHNIVVDEGLNYILDSALSGATPATTHYVGLFKNNYTPISTNVMATFPGAGIANEANTEYDEASRPTWSEAGVSAKTITNSASPATFTFNTPVTIYGAFLSSNATKAGTSGVLISAAKFSAARSMLAADVLNITYTLKAQSS